MPASCPTEEPPSPAAEEPESRDDDPPTRVARALEQRAPSILTSAVPPRDPLGRATLGAWLDAIPLLARRELTGATRDRLEDSRRICAELAAVLDGGEPGEGRAPDRTLHLALARGRVQGVCSMFACPRGTFVELLATAPWNVLGEGDPPDPRTVRGAGTALVAAAARWSAARGCGGRVALQAENPRAAAFYARLGFRAIEVSDEPLSLVPSGDRGWSPSILRVARGAPGPEEARSPWVVLDVRAASARAPAAAAVR